MDSLKDVFNSIGPHLPFMMAATPGKVKVNVTRFTEIFIILAFLWHGFGEIKAEMKQMREDNKKTTIEFKEDKAKTGLRLGTLEGTVNKIEKVVFKPIKSYREVNPDTIEFD